jgi:hypothetical protein
MRWLPCIALSILACRDPKSTSTQPPVEPIEPDRPTPTAEPQDPAAALATLEERVLAATRVSIVFEIVAEGMNTANLRGVLELGPTGKMRLDARGSFAGEAGEVHFVCDGSTMKGERGGKRFELPVAPALRESVVLGLLRMGLLHNVAVLWNARPPDRSDGDIREWVVTTGHRYADADRGIALVFDVVVDPSTRATPIGTATLELDSHGLPARREQVVHFPEGDMRVVERYESFELGGS